MSSESAAERLIEGSRRQAALVSHLCSSECLPRYTGSKGARSAGRYLADELAAIGLEPAGTAGFLQEIPAIGGANVLGALPGRSDRWIVLGAHYDACWDVPGADDNASGVAVTIEVARQLRASALEHSVLVALFDAEEPPNFLTPEMGSQWFVDHPTIPLDRIDSMVCLDLVGRSLGHSLLPERIRNTVFVLGTETGTDTPEAFDQLPETPGIVPRRLDNYIIPPLSDYHAFNMAAIPFLFYSTGRSEHYHAPTDTPDRLNYSKMSALATHLAGLIEVVGHRIDRPTYLPDGVDDFATVATLEGLLEELGPYVTDASSVKAVVEPMRHRLNRDGVLSHTDRESIVRLVFSVEGALA